MFLSENSFKIFGFTNIFSLLFLLLVVLINFSSVISDVFGEVDSNQDGALSKLEFKYV